MATRRTYNAHQSSLSEIGNEDDDISVASSGAVDHFFDCVSRFSTDTSDQSVNFLGRPVALPCQYAFETSQEFYPEQYTSDTLGQSRICVVAIKRTLSMRPMVKFFLVFSETRRRMRRVVVSATFSDLRKHEAILQVWAPDSQERGLKYLPSPLKPLLINLVLGLPSSSMVANLSVAFREDDSGQMLLDSHRLKTEDDTLETQLSDHARMMRDIDDLGCPQVLESEVAILKHLHSAVYEVFVGSALYLEQKAPFASGGREGENRFLDCFEDMKMLIAMRDCSGVSRFIGVVLDDNRRRLEGYLLERPVLWSIEDVIHKANALQETIPSGLRLHWACQVVRIILELHERGIVVGKVTLQSFGIREDGSAVLCHVASSSKHLENSRGLMPPELRVAPGSSCERPPGDFNFKTDIFQLGYVLWQLIEHVKPWQGYFCDLLRCQSFPRYQCDAVHANPVQLPSCSSLVPSYYEAFMEKCRLADPTRRSSAQDLRELLRLMDDCEMYVPNVRELFSRYQDSSFKYYEVTCIECNKVIDDLCYHCNSCNEADFDLCSECFGRGVRCWSPEHSLIKLREGEEVQEAS
ncbi:MAG: hypothetical protein M1828_001904 [Chrysothrix sp. TS-e1954]|nr:MAG: hypothetical protein M1828_001904 [Chrysothrix sp. TS-e1954]